jgi:hypothetical protein
MFLTSPDGTKIVYDYYGAGPAVILLHTGRGNRQEWQEAGYGQRLHGEPHLRVRT